METFKSKSACDCFVLAASACVFLSMPVYGSEVVDWGDSNQAQMALTCGNDFIAVSAGIWHSLALNSDYGIVGWGENVYGQATPPAGNDFIAVSAGGWHSIALKSDGSIVGWGSNTSGQATPPAGNDFIAVSAGGSHSLALKSDGSIAGWGWNIYGQATPPAGNNFIAVSAGWQHSIALKSDGSIAGWGWNIYGQATPPAGNDFIAVSAGGYHSLALKSDGSIVGWGDNSYGQATPPAGNDFIAVSAGWLHSIALKSDGSIVNWGDSSCGLANQPAGNDFIAISAGACYNLALKSFALVGENKWVQLPDETSMGMDIRVDRNDGVQRTLADDFECTQPGPITDVHFWGSWKNDVKGNVVRIHLSIHDDIPADPNDPNSYSKPGDLLWQMDFNTGEFTETLVADISPYFEWWWDPNSLAVPPDPNGDQRIYRYDIYIDPNYAFVQEGRPDDPVIYWLDIYVLTDSGMFGWKTSRKHCNDDAVYAVLPGAPPPWQELLYRAPHPFAPDSIDLAFAITTQPIVESNQACCLPDGSCEDITPAECIEKGGTPQGAGTGCSTTSCPAPPLPTEACCLPNGNCADLTLAECLAAGGTPQGSGTACASVVCPNQCDVPEPNCPPGRIRKEVTRWGGIRDNFAASPSDPPPTPDTALLGYLNCNTWGQAGGLQFDEIPGMGGVRANSWFGHTFSNLSSCEIMAATLEIRLRATTGGGSGLVGNDTISIVNSIAGCSRTDKWSSRISNLPEAGGAWVPGQVATFCLDLDALPTTGGPVSILDFLNARRSLSIFVQDDTGVDYVVLKIVCCPCEFQLGFEILAGVNDNFLLPVEPASPSAELTYAFGGRWRRFDERRLSFFFQFRRQFGHTFIIPSPGDIVSAELEINLRAGKFLPTNDDTLALEFLNPKFAWSESIATLTGMAWNAGDTALLVLDLGDLPPVAGVVSVLGALADGDFDVYIRDNTIVDYALLRYWRCCEKAAFKDGDINLDGIVNFEDFAVLADQWLTSL